MNVTDSAHEREDDGARAPFPGGESASMEDWLWAYAEGVLTPDEAAWIRNRVASDPGLGTRLAGMRAALREAASASPHPAPALEPRPERCESAAERWLREIARAGEEVGCVLDRWASGLRLAWAGPGWRTADASGGLLSGPSAGEATSVRPAATLRLPDGSVLDVLDAGADGLTLRIDLNDPSATGTVRLRCRVPAPGSEWHGVDDVSGRLEQGRTVLRGCPEGLLWLDLPGRRPLVVAVRPGVGERDAEGP